MSHEELLDATVKTKADFKEFDFPIHFQFKLGTISNDFVAKDNSERTLAYVRQKMFKLKEAIMVYSEESKTNLLYQIKADRIIDFNASYEFTDTNDSVLGSIGRKGMRSLWKAHYEIFYPSKNPEYHIQEENPWSKVGDILFSEIPLLGMFTGYVFNPKYGIVDQNGNTVARLSKQPSFFGRKFKLEKVGELKAGDSERLLLSLMMMMLLERRRG
jgi:uncharacterized protein YxjI